MFWYRYHSLNSSYFPRTRPDRLKSPCPVYTPSPRRVSVSMNEGNRYDTFPARNTETRAGESLVSTDAGSTNSLDHVAEVVNVTSPSGHLGETGQVAWMNPVFEGPKKSGHDACVSVVELCSQEATDTTSEAREMGLSRRGTRGTLLTRPDKN